MSYLKFDKDLIISLEYSLYRNVLRTNRRGAYHNTSISGCNTTKYQGLLVMPVPNLDDDNHLILSSFDETIIQHGAEFNLGIHKYSGDNYSPRGHKYIREFSSESIPKTVYRVGGVILSKEVMFSSQQNSVMIRYKLLEAHSPTTIRFKPFLGFRNVFSLTQENDNVDKSYREIENGISTCMYEGYPEIYMQFNTKAEFVFEPHWNKGVEYIQDMQANDTYKEDLYVPGYFEIPITKGDSVIFAAGDILKDTATLAKEFDNEIERRTPRSSFYNCLKNSSHQFFYTPNSDEQYLLAGYPWFKVRARDQFISLPGCTISVNRTDDFEKIMDTAIPYMKSILDGKPIEGLLKQLDDPDLPLWVIWSLQQFFKERPEVFQKKYAPIVLTIINYILDNKHNNLNVDESNGLLHTHGHDKPVSWMNAVIDGRPVVPRSGYLVEFNALWYNALKFGQEIYKTNGDDIMEYQLSLKSDIVKESFATVFLNSSGYLYDYVDSSQPDWSLRPNMLFAVSLDYSPLEKHRQRSIVDYATKELLTPGGIRSLSPKGDNFNPYYSGSFHEKENAYFNGPAFPWLLGPYIEAYLKVYQRSGLSLVERIMVDMEDEMSNDCIGTISELYDSSPPFIAHGAYSFAMSVAELLRAKRLMKNYR
ncbi:MAG TPA: glycogen debranching enzyme N-terminal domain-containing protein [Dysgonamonadaceae bacterium]|nr:glycogen debranching enzyme N-terminal domain-containing protein [Dysgonamonadaceae bacterium]